MKTDGGWIINGAKMWITNSPIADIAVVWAKAKEHKDDPGVIRGFILEKDMKGHSAPHTKYKMSLRASETGELVFDDVFVPDEQMFPEIKGPGLHVPEFGSIWYCLGTIGAAEFAISAHVGMC